MSDNPVILVFVSGTLLLALFALFIITYSLVQKQKQNAYQLEKSAMIYNHQNKLLIARVEEQENTMDQISKEIHDNLGQLLGLLKMNIIGIGKRATGDDQLRLIETTKKLADHLLRDVQSISHSMNSDFIKKRGLINVLEDELEYLSVSCEIKCSIEKTGEQKTFKPDKELLIYRIAQEAIHNVNKHSYANELSIALEYEDNTFVMKIADNGKGFEKQKIYDLNGIGFLNMFHRAKLLNGSLDIESAPGEGCTIALRLDNIDTICISNVGAVTGLKQTV